MRKVLKINIIHLNTSNYPAITICHPIFHGGNSSGKCCILLKADVQHVDAEFAVTDAARDCQIEKNPEIVSFATISQGREFFSSPILMYNLVPESHFTPFFKLLAGTL